MSDPTKPVRRVAPPIDLDYLRRNDFWSRVAVGADDECWLWKLGVGNHGYGNTWDKIQHRLAHRVAWELTNGRIPAGLTIDHTCRVRRCCNPSHLRLLTNLDNATDNGKGRRTHCPQGHEYTEENTYRTARKPTWRRCRTCMEARDAERRVRLMLGFIVGHYGHNRIDLGGWGLLLILWATILLAPWKPKT